MSYEQLHLRDLDGHTVWITTYRPAVFDSEKNLYVEKGIICAFRIDAEPKMVDGEYIKENGKTKFFPDQNSALCAAFEAARKIIRPGA